MTTNKSPSIIRQEWIDTSVGYFREHFKSCYWTAPDNMRLSVGFPVGSRDGQRKLGICHSQEWSGDKHWEIFISPEYTDTKEVLETIAHEMVHATVATPGHRGKFKQCATAIGFDPPMAYTPAGPKMLEVINWITSTIGPFPAGVLSLASRKKQKTNMKKCSCTTCGYVCYATMKWISSVGEPICPVDRVQMNCDDGEG